MAYFWPLSVGANNERQAADENLFYLTPTDHGQTWQPPLGNYGAQTDGPQENFYSFDYRTSCPPIRLGFDPLIEEIYHEIPFYFPSFLNEPEENSFYESSVENVDIKEQHLDSRKPQASYEVLYSQPREQNQIGPTIGFEPFVPPPVTGNPCPGQFEDLSCYDQSSRYNFLPMSNSFEIEGKRWNEMPPLGFKGAFTEYDSVETNRRGNWHGVKSRSKSMHANVGTTTENLHRRFTVGPCWPSPIGNDTTYTQAPAWSITLLDIHQGSNDRLSSFCDTVKKIRDDHLCSNPNYNSGKIWSITTTVSDRLQCNTSFRVLVHLGGMHQPLMLTPKADCLVRHFIREILHHTNQYPPQEDYFLSWCGSDEFLKNDHTLGSHEPIQKASSDVILQLHKESAILPCLARTHEDDKSQFNLNERMDCPYILRVSRKSMVENGSYGLAVQRVWTELKEGRKILQSLTAAIMKYCSQLGLLIQKQCPMSTVVKEVKTICCMLSSVETKEIRDAVEALRLASLQSAQPNASYLQQGNLETAAIVLSRAISNLIYIYSRSFHTDFQTEAVPRSIECSETKADSRLSFTLYSGHNIPEQWTKRYNDFSVSCSLSYAGKKLCQVKNCRKKTAENSLFFSVTWDERIDFPVHVQSLPLETMLNLKLYGTGVNTETAHILGWTCLPLYQNQRLIHGTKLMGLALHSELPAVITPGAFDLSVQALVTLQINFPEAEQTFIKPKFEQKSNTVQTEEYLKHIEQLSKQQPSLLLLPEAEKGFLWFYRTACNSRNCFLPLVLGSAPGWDPHTVSAIHAVLRNWRFSNPLDALGLLTSSFSDQDVREAAVQEIGSLSDEDLLECLPQLVQAFKFEWHLESPLVKLLLTRSLQSIRVAHQLFWLLTDALNEDHFGNWYQKLLVALQFCVGKALNDEFSKEKQILKILEDTAEKVKAAHDSKRQEVLKKEIHRLETLFLEIKFCRLPLDPALAVRGINTDRCSYFTSNAFPLKVSFINADPLGTDINVIFKAGDDLRQDMLVLQIIRVMDRIWLQEGLDMRMIIYKCQSTGKGQGLVLMVPDATTLAKIHRNSGIIGPLKESTIQKWFNQKHPMQANYQKASENFFFSCAGWCVVTFILGVCDRHNDNIMLTNTGHMFHIDFGKFLGHSQKFGSIKRDRAPFIFTSEMEFFITQGGKNKHRFQDFVELCCRAYNIVRKRSHLILNLLDLMLQAGLPELNCVQDLKYVHNNLRPHDSDLEATSFFTRKIKESVECFPVKLNNMIHILAQMSLSNPAKSTSQLNSQEPCTVQVTDRSIRRATVLRFSKTHERLYLVQVLRSNGTVSLTEKTFTQFLELHGQLQYQFPGLLLPVYPSGPNISSADLDCKRMQDLNVYLSQIFCGSYELAHNEYVLQFFLDESKDEQSPQQSSFDAGYTSSLKYPCVQLLISHENQKLTILLKHLKNIHMPDRSAPSAHVEVYLLPDPDEVSRRKTKAKTKNSNPTFNEIIEYYGVLKLQGRILKLIVKSKGTFLVSVNIHLGSVHLNEERWYPLGKSHY
ncbi:phosphatidylinositol 3-kinase C2 domain-containing subunit gamma [Lissotriton helveticus]